MNVSGKAAYPSPFLLTVHSNAPRQADALIYVANMGVCRSPKSSLVSWLLEEPRRLGLQVLRPAIRWLTPSQLQARGWRDKCTSLALTIVVAGSSEGHGSCLAKFWGGVDLPPCFVLMLHENQSCHVSASSTILFWSQLAVCLHGLL